MGIKLGELLINEGLITQDQLDEALKCHVVFGVKLGSALIELGFVREDSLLNLLSKKLGVTSVTHTAFANVSDEVIARISPAIAAKFRVVPIRLEQKRLHVAMTDPTDLKAQEELSFITGNIIVPNIAPELQILYALEKYYGIRLDHRYVSASCELKRLRSYSKSEDAGKFIYDDSQYSISADIEQNAVVSGEGTEPAVKEPARKMPAPPQPAPVTPKQPEPAPAGLYPIEKLLSDLARAEKSDDVADMFIRYLAQVFGKCALFTVRGKTAVGWRGSVGGKVVPAFGTVTLELPQSPELADLLEKNSYFYGTLTKVPVNLPLTKALDLSIFSSVLVLPVVMNERMVAMIVVSGDTGLLQNSLAELQLLAAKASLAFQILVLRNKLQQL